jgi:hypothetical protein
MTGTVIYLACAPSHPVSVGLRIFEVVGVLLPVAGLVLLIIDSAKQPPQPFQGYPAGKPPQANYPGSAFPGYPQQWGGYPPVPPPRSKPKGTAFTIVGVALLVFGLLCLLGLWTSAC